MSDHVTNNSFAEASRAMAPDLAAALVDAQSRARAVGKDGTNKFHNYKYASAEAMIEEARGALNDAGLALMQIGWSLEGERCETKLDAKTFVIVGRVAIVYRLLHKGGAFVDWVASTPVVPEKGRPDDKAEMGALTANLGYVLRGLLLLPREDADASIDRRDDREHRNEDRREQTPQSERRPTQAAAASSDAIAPFLERLGAAGDLDAVLAVGKDAKDANLPDEARFTVFGDIFVTACAYCGTTAELEELSPKIKSIGFPKEHAALARLKGAFDARYDKLSTAAA